MFLRSLTLFTACVIFLRGQVDAAADLPPEWPPATPTQAQRRGSQNDTPLHWASYEGQLSLVRHLLDLGSDVNARLKDGSTPLHLAAHQGQTEVAELLLERGAQVNAENDRGLTPLDWALRRHQQTTARVLLSYNATASSHVEGTDVNTLSVLYMGNGSPGQLDLSLTTPREQTASTTTDEATKPRTAPPPPPVGQFSLQLGAVVNKDLAQGMWKRMRRDHPEELSELTLRLVDAHSGGRLFHRLIAGQMPKQHARARCSALQQHGQSCLVVVTPR